MAVRYPRLDVIFSDHRAALRAVTTASAPAAKAAPAVPAAPAERVPAQAGPVRAATVRAIRPQAGDDTPPNGLAIDPDQRVATVDGREVDLTFMEFELLAHLVANPLRVHSRRQLMESVWGRPDNGDTRTISTHIARIRRKLGPGHRPTLATVRQVGYKYDPRLAAAA
ncbi:winged helix-turn-helix domain-containing protein [Kitasatospora sp. NPDC059408]|uniref:winged helix-turn-helix domain-containing protein n=1 Tax=Kitasatospora sp. NPDC059408 TaxID=3346823 RepID=UPI00369D17CB